MSGKKSIGGFAPKPSVMLKRGVFVLLLLLCVAFTAGSQQDRPAGDRRGERRRSSAETPAVGVFSFTIQNNTTYVARRIFVRRAGNSDWGNNVLRERLSSGDSVTISLDHVPDGPYSIRMVDVDGDTYSKNNIIISEGSTITIVIGDLDL